LKQRREYAVESEKLPWKMSVNERVLVYMLNGSVVGGLVSGKSGQSVQLAEAFRVKEVVIRGTSELMRSRSGSLGAVEIPFTSISRWQSLPQDLQDTRATDNAIRNQ
jgi:hypothetical protein